MSEIYKCQICYKVAEVLSQGGGNLFCCNTPMEALRENIDDTQKLTHLPFMEKIPKIKGTLRSAGGPRGAVMRGCIPIGLSLVITAGKPMHPMEDKHFIEWIEVKIDDELYRKYFTAKCKPIMEITISKERSDKFVMTDIITAKAYCNVHGLWKTEMLWVNIEKG